MSFIPWLCGTNFINWCNYISLVPRWSLISFTAQRLKPRKQAEFNRNKVGTKWSWLISFKTLCRRGKKRPIWPYQLFYLISQQVFTGMWTTISHLIVYKMDFSEKKMSYHAIPEHFSKKIWNNINKHNLCITFEEKGKLLHWVVISS